MTKTVKVDRRLKPVVDEERITACGWYWYDSEYQDEGSTGPYAKKCNAQRGARRAGVPFAVFFFHAGKIKDEEHCDE